MRRIGTLEDNLLAGEKGCPRAAGYGLWFLGRLVGGGRAVQNWPIDRVNKDLGKNAAYAIIAVDLLASGAKPSHQELWPGSAGLLRSALPGTIGNDGAR